MHRDLKSPHAAAVAIASWTAVALHRFCGAGTFQSARGPAQSRTWRRFGRAAIFLGAMSIAVAAFDSFAQTNAAARVLSLTNFPGAIEADYVVKDFHFQSGETLPELRMHYLALGKPQRDKRGVVRNAVIVLHGTTGTGSQFLRAEFAGELFGKGQPLDVTRYYVILPDNIGHGKSSKPSDGLHAKFPELRLPRHDRGAVPAADRRLERRSSAAGDGHVDGRHAHVAVGRECTRISWTR